MTGDNDSPEQAIADLQTRVAFQEDTLHALNEVIASQDVVISRLQEQMRVLNKKLDDVANSLDQRPTSAGDEPPPPHY